MGVFFRVLLRTPTGPHMTGRRRDLAGRRHALRLVVLPIALIMATGAVAPAPSHCATARFRPGWAGPVATVPASQAPGGVAVASSAPQVTPEPPPASSGPLLGQPPQVVYRGSAAKKVVALTFDDGWSSKNGRLILAILVHEHVKATFFVNSVWLAKDPQPLAGDRRATGSSSAITPTCTRT